jgi:hypothetical protein
MSKFKIGSNQHQIRHKGLKPEATRSLFKLLFIASFLIVAWNAYKMQNRIRYYQWRDANIHAAPCANFCSGYSGQVYAAEPEVLTVDEMVDKYSDKYGSSKWLKLRTKALIHYLLLRESAYGSTTNCGDHGLACGPMQFHAATYTANRQRMMKLALVDHMGSRLDMEDAIETATWMIAVKGQEKQWGPVLRGEIKL